MMDRQPDRLRVLALSDGPFAQVEIGKLCRAIHQVLKIRRRELHRCACRDELRCRLPVRRGRLKTDLDRPVRHALCPDEGRGHVEVRMGEIDLGVRAVGAVSVERIGNGHRAIMVRHRP